MLTRLLARLSVGASVFGLSSCSLLVSVDGLAGPATAFVDGPDAERGDVANPDGRTADGRTADADTSRGFCSRQIAQGLVFCDDFDLPGQSADQLWTGTIVGPSASLSIVEVDGRSRALAVSAPSSGSPPNAELDKELPPELVGKKRIELTWSFAIVESGLQYAAVGLIAFTNATMATFNGVAGYLGSQKVGPLPLPPDPPLRALPRLAWTTAKVLLVRETDRFVRTTWIDGTLLQTVTLAPINAGGAGVHLSFGALHTSSNAGSHELLIDDILLRAE